MKSILYTLGIVIFLNSCNSNTITSSPYSSENLKIEKISEHIFRHISYLDTNDFGKVSCNGMIYFNKNKAIVFDTPTNDEASAELINWLGEKDIEAVVVTHFHADCLAGLKEFHSNGIKSYASNKTIELAKANNYVLPQNGFDKKLEINIGSEIVLTKYFGQGHTIDNVIGYIPSQKAMFGGCLIKRLDAGKGNLEDANTVDWPITVATIKKEFPEVEVIIPGHGKNGGIELLDYTIELFTEK